MEYKFTTDNFKQEVIESDLPVLVDFYADWCGPCKMMAPVIAQIAGEYDGKIKVGKINVDDEPDLAQNYNVMSIPMLAIFKNGEIVEKSVGAVSKVKLQELIDKVLA
ncbi:MAG: thioredoxin [Butyrivibrio sp.]|nr:thioredoxin [Butyrivibrio sp.]